MKESEYIKKEMQEDDSENDFRCLNYFRKKRRAERQESFENQILPLLKTKHSIIEKMNGFEIITKEYGKIIFYPKANSLLFVRTNNWIKKYALNWIKKWLI